MPSTRPPKKNGERLQVFVMQLEGNLNQLQLRFPAKIVEHEVGKQLRDRHFSGMHKGLRDSIRYIYDNLEYLYPAHAGYVEKPNLRLPLPKQ